MSSKIGSWSHDKEQRSIVKHNRDFSRSNKEHEEQHKNAAILRSLEPYCPTLCNKKRWTGKHDVLQKWTIIRDVLMEAIMDDGSNFRMNRILQFNEKVKKFERVLHFVKLTAKCL